MNQQFNDDNELVTALGKLPREINPKRDLWPGIASRLGATRPQAVSSDSSRGWRRPALAASIAVAFVAGLLFGRQMGESDLPMNDAPGPDFAIKAALQAGEREYHAAFREFVSIGSSRAVLQTDTIESIKSSWHELQMAESALLAALQDYPENTYLNHKLLDLRAQQLGFMQQLAMLDQYSRRII